MDDESLYKVFDSLRENLRATPEGLTGYLRGNIEYLESVAPVLGDMEDIRIYVVSAIDIYKRVLQAFEKEDFYKVPGIMNEINESDPFDRLGIDERTVYRLIMEEKSRIAMKFALDPDATC